MEARTGQSAPGTAADAQETSATDEQPASTSPARDGEASKTGSEPPTDSTPQQRLSRAERKALKTAQAAEAAPAPPEAATVDTSAAPAAPAEPGDRIERIERTLTDAIARIEARLPNPEQPSEPVAPQQSDDDAAYYGDDAEFVRLATIATRPNASGEYLSDEQARNLEMWSVRREARDRARASSEQQYRLNQTQIALQAAEAHGIDRDSLFSAPTMRAIYDTFVERGRALEREAAATTVAAKDAEIERLTGVNRQLADEIEAYEARLPGFARPLVAGGMSAGSRGLTAAERARLSGRDVMRRALESPRRNGRPGAR